MNFRNVLVLVASAFTALVGCGGGNLCQRLNDAGKRAQGTCPCPAPSGCAVSSTCLSNCPYEGSSCTSDDKTKLGTFADCVGKVTPCTPGNENAWISALASCGAALSVSDACKQAASGC